MTFFSWSREGFPSAEQEEALQASSVSTIYVGLDINRRRRLGNYTDRQIIIFSAMLSPGCCELAPGSEPRAAALGRPGGLKALVLPDFLLRPEFSAACFRGREITESLWALFYMVGLEIASWVYRSLFVCFTSLHCAWLGCIIFPQFWSGNVKFDKTWNLQALSPPCYPFSRSSKNSF